MDKKNNMYIDFISEWTDISDSNGVIYNKAGETGKLVYPCPKCGKFYRWKKNRAAHLRNECGKEASVYCPYCPHVTKFTNNLRKHIVRKHNCNYK